jgi:hypothetical protein
MNPAAKNSGVRRSTSKPLSKEEKSRKGSENKMNKIDLFSPKNGKRDENNQSNISDVIQHSKSTTQPSTKASTRNTQRVTAASQSVKAGVPPSGRNHRAPGQF